MRQDSRLARVLHVLLHLDAMDEPATSEHIAQMLGTNAAVVRRTMAGLRKADFVESTRGHGGGWVLSRSLETITLLDIYEALGSPSLFAMGVDGEDSTCRLARAANDATHHALAEARRQFHESLSKITVADIAKAA